MTMDRWQAPGKLTNLNNRSLENTLLDSLAETTLHQLPLEKTNCIQNFTRLPVHSQTTDVVTAVD